MVREFEGVAWCKDGTPGSFGTFCIDFVRAWELGAQRRHPWTLKEAKDCVLFTSVLLRT